MNCKKQIDINTRVNVMVVNNGLTSQVYTINIAKNGFHVKC